MTDMKMYYITSARMPTEKAHGLQIVKMCEAFGRAGVTVELIVPNRKNDIVQDIYNFYGVERVFSVTRLKTPDWFRFGSFAFYVAIVLFYLRARIFLLGKSRDVIFTRQPLASLFFPDVILEIHRMIQSKPVFFRWALHRADMIVSTNQWKKDEMVRVFDQDSEKIIVVHNGIDIDDFDIKINKSEARRRTNLPMDKYIVMYVGSLQDWKGYRILIEASRHFNNDILAVIVGGSEKQIVDLRMQYDTTHSLFVPHVDRSAVPIYLKAADAVAILNIPVSRSSTHETSPIKLFEYMASRRPIIASDLPSIREVLNEENSFLISPSDPAALALQINTIYAHPKEAERRAKRSRRDVEQYTWEKRADRIMNTYTNTRLS